jgi:hypothetical protein
MPASKQRDQPKKKRLHRPGRRAEFISEEWNVRPDSSSRPGGPVAKREPSPEGLRHSNFDFAILQLDSAIAATILSIAARSAGSDGL